jgi:two-component system, LytTR family, response regulator
VSAKVPALIAEDEPHAREALQAHLSEIDWIDVVAVTGDGRSALTLFEERRPRLLFLDVRLPELSGLEVARRLAGSAEIVFTTAYDRYAVSAFELGALDYLVKPFGRERLAAAVDRVRRRAGPPAVDAGERARTSLAPGPLTRLFARRGDRIVPIAVSGIRRVQARGDYAEIHCADGEFLVSVSLAELAARLDPARFRQVHRSHIVNLDQVRELTPHDDRRLAIALKDGTVIVASRAASEDLRRLVR